MTGPGLDGSPRRPGPTLSRYLVREMLSPGLLALGGLTLMVLTRDLLGFSDLAINRGLGAGQVLPLAFVKVVPLVTMILPFAVLIGILSGLGRLGADRELLVLEASGISAPRLLPAVLRLAALATVVGLGLSLVASPWANRQLDRMLGELSRRNPGASVTSGVVHTYGDWKLQAREVNARGDRMRGVLLYMPDIGETIFAERGTLAPTEDGSVGLHLEHGTLVLSPRENLGQLRFDRMEAVLPESNLAITRSPEEQIGGLDLAQLAAAAEGGGTGADPELARAARVELHRRFALPLATFVLGAMAIPLFLSRSHFSRAGGTVLGMGATLAYYGLVQAGDGLASSGRVSVPVGVWLPDAVLGAVALVWILRSRRLSAFGRHSDRPRSRERPARRRGGARMRMRRWPLARYVAVRFLELSALCFGALLLAYLLVDVLERLQWFAEHRASAVDILRFYGARVWLLASRVVPMALLVATALTVSLLAAQGELMGMRACGISSGRGLLPVLVLSAVAVPLFFLFTNEVVPRTNALADRLKTTEIKKESSDGSFESVWYRVGTHLYEAQRLDLAMGYARAIKIYELGPDGLPVSRADARSARHVGRGVWRLYDPVRVEIHGAALQRVPAAPFAELGDTLPAEVDTMHLDVAGLAREIREVEKGGYDATMYRVDLQSKLAAPMGCLILPALALFYAVTGPPFPTPVRTLLVSAVVAVAWVLVNGIGVSLGYGGVVRPAVGGWGPSLLFAGVVAWLGWRLRGQGQTL